MTNIRIPFNRPTFVGNERKYLELCLAAGHLSGSGSFSHRCCEFLETRLGCDRALLTNSCTDALEMCGLLLDIGPAADGTIPVVMQDRIPRIECNHDVAIPTGFHGGAEDPVKILPPEKHEGPCVEAHSLLIDLVHGGSGFNPEHFDVVVRMRLIATLCR